ncbi:MAG: hypothetical protein GY748_17095, partial [Planctomycetaceae bacterium]|nr:hypothetical protein [Planctomycetaceae bacterium]
SITTQQTTERKVESNRYLRENDMQLFALQARLAIDSFAATPASSAVQPTDIREAILANELGFLRSQLGDKF